MLKSIIFVFFFLVNSTASITPIKIAKKDSLFDLIKREEVLNITLETDLDALFKDIRSQEYIPAKIEFENINGQPLKMDLEIGLRGKYRRIICDFPPIRLNFNKEDLKKRDLKAKFDKMKLVTHCLNNKKESKSNVIREYMAYQIYEKLTNQSLRTQLVQITYKDLKKKKGHVIRYGIIIEDNDQMAKRIDGKICEDCINISSERIEPMSASMSAVFQYMIANADWNLKKQKNIKLILSKDNDLLKVVPYDFDFSAFVDAPYALPNADYKQKSISDRVFLWTFPSNEMRTKTLQIYKDRKQEIYDYCQSFELLCKKDRKAIIKQLDSFYKMIENENQLDQIFTETKQAFQ